MRIATHYQAHPVTGGGRIMARGQGRQKCVPYNHAINAGDNHREAAIALFRKMEPEVKALTARWVSDYTNPNTGRITLNWEVKETTPC